MKVSIITAAFNSSSTVKDCILSVENQTYKNIEHLIIDGASTDNTIEIVNSVPNRIQKVVSEPDKGVYDALNKGIALATGDIIGFLHTDDVFDSEKTIANIVTVFEESSQGIAGTYGDLIYVDRNNPGKLIRYWKSNSFNAKALAYGWMPPHPTLFLRKEVYEKYGSFCLSYEIAADYDFMIRIMKDTNLKFLYLPEVISVMRLGGISNNGIGNILKKSKEDLSVIRKYKLGGLFTLFFKNLRKVKQFLKSN